MPAQFAAGYLQWDRCGAERLPLCIYAIRTRMKKWRPSARLWMNVALSTRCFTKMRLIFISIPKSVLTGRYADSKDAWSRPDRMKNIIWQVRYTAVQETSATRAAAAKIRFCLSACFNTLKRCTAGQKRSPLSWITTLFTRVKKHETG